MHGPFDLDERDIEPVTKFRQKPFASIVDVIPEKAISVLEEHIQSAVEQKMEIALGKKTEEMP